MGPLFCTLVPMEVTMEVFMELTVTDMVSVTHTVLVTVTVSVTTVTTPQPSKLEPFTLTDGPMDPTTESDPLSMLLAKGRLRPKLKLTPLFCTLVPMEVTMEVFMAVTVMDMVSVMLTVLVTVTVSVTTVTTPELSKLEPFTLTDGPMDPTTDSDLFTANK